MKKFVIVSDSCCELTAQMRKQYDVEYIPMYVSYEGKELRADVDWKEISAEEFYGIMRSDVRIFTSQVPVADYMARFEEYLAAGFDVLSVSCSSGLSASVRASEVARDALKEKYPEAEIICVDSLTCGMGLGLLCVYASRLRAEGKNIREVAEAIEGVKLRVNQVGTVDELKYLKRAGRISASKALFGAMFNVKPIVGMNARGENVSTEKTKGRGKSLERLAQLVKEKYTGEAVEEIFISHGDCQEDAQRLRAMILQQLPSARITLNILNPIMGASCGPNTIAMYFVGEERRAEEAE